MTGGYTASLLSTISLYDLRTCVKHCAEFFIVIAAGRLNNAIVQPLGATLPAHVETAL